ncbi:MAG: hypothetical protein PHI29_12020 [Gallionella sp.]|nr:hypothetical protein [Gallionella sp.]
MIKHSALWTTPAPLWGRFSPEPGSAASFMSEDQSAPAILRFANDEFMEQLIATLATDPKQLGELIARPETWRTPAVAAPDLVERVPLPRIVRSLARLRTAKASAPALEPSASELDKEENGVARTLPLKLFHPAHQRHYLVAANLVCGRAGFPDREVATSSAEQVGFVLRRMLPVDAAVADSPLEEYAFVKEVGGGHWQRVITDLASSEADASLVAGEELLPMFPLNFRDDSGHPRRMLAGVVPVGRREEYMSSRAQVQADVPGAGGIAANPSVVAARKEQFKMEITEPWKNLIRSSLAAADRIMDASSEVMGNNDKLNAARRANDQIQGQSYLILLDFADYLYLHLSPVWACLIDTSKQASLQNDAQRRLFNWLNDSDAGRGANNLWPITQNGRSFKGSLREALLAVRSTAVREALESATRSFPDDLDDGLEWPDFVYLLAGVRGTSANYSSWGIHSSLAAKNIVVANEDIGATDATLSTVESEVAKLDKLVQLVIQAIDLQAPATPAPPLPFAARLRDALTTTQGDAGWFTMRCVYLRCDCGPQRMAVLSEPSQRFQLANFFDSDAPARPIRISLPLDTTPAGMRKHSKNTAFVISDVLCGQIQRAKGLGLVDLVRAVLPWPLHKDLDVGGMGPCKSNEANIGMICSLSIPIITICALILLMIIVSLLDFIFRWMPWFIMCFPIPGLKAKKGKP